MNNRFYRNLAIALMAALILCIPVSAKSSRILPGFQINQKKGAKDWHYDLCIGFEDTCRIPVGSSVSATILLPADLLAKKNTLALETGIEVKEYQKDGPDIHYGEMPSKDRIIIKVDKKGKVSLQREKRATGEKLKMNKLASIKKSGKYYVLKINKMTFEDGYFPDDVEWNPENLQPVDPAKDYGANVQFNLNSMGNKLNKKVKAYIFFDNVVLKTSKSIKLSIEDVNTRYFDSWMGPDVRAPKKLAVISY